MHKARCIITDEHQTVGILLMEHGEPNHVAAMLEYARLQMLKPPFMGRWNPAGLASFISYIANYEIRRIRHAIDRAQPRKTRLFNAVDSELVPIQVLQKGYQILVPTEDGPVPATITDIGYEDDGEGRITVDRSGKAETCTPGRMAWLIPGKKGMSTTPS